MYYFMTVNKDLDCYILQNVTKQCWIINWMLIIMENSFFSQIINVTLHHFSKSAHLTENNYEFLIGG